MSSFGKVFTATPAGSLHKALKVPTSEPIPVRLLRQAVKWRGSPRRRALAAKAALVLRMKAKRGEL